MDPEYQRMGDIWTTEKRQLLIDSILNGFDIPKIYFHKFAKPECEDGVPVRYAIVDGRQRLAAIWKFVDGDYPLSDDFSYLDDTSLSVGGPTYKDLDRNFRRSR